MADEAKKAGNFVKYKIRQLAENPNESSVRAILAKLRRGIGKEPGSIPELWDVTFDGLPNELIGKGGDPTCGEWAVHAALTLYALHQQGKDLKKQCMNKEGEYLGVSLRNLIRNDEDEQRIKRRFDAAVTSNCLEELTYHLRGLIQILKAQDIPLDYPALTEDLYWFQFPDIKDSVRLRWGRDFYRVRSDAESHNEKA